MIKFFLFAPGHYKYAKGSMCCLPLPQNYIVIFVIIHSKSP